VKFIIDVPYGDYVLSHEDALAFIGIMERAEKYDTMYHRDPDSTASGTTTHHVFRSERTAMMTMRHMPETMYEMAKLAGPKPTTSSSF
jgi:hypothetical protein